MRSAPRPVRSRTRGARTAIGPMPVMISRSGNLLAMIVFEKYGQHQPLNRQRDRYAREGVDLSLSTLADQVGACTVALRPLHDLIAAHVLAAECLLTLHSDRGAPMTSKCTAQLLADLGVTRSLSRPQVSDDNPFSEAQFKTLKYHPGFPGRFHDIAAAIAFCRTFFPWYNTEHRHGGIAMLTPDDVHHNRTQSVLEQRGRTLQAAWTRHPERFVRGIPQPDPLPQAVWINPPVTPTTGETAQ